MPQRKIDHDGFAVDSVMKHFFGGDAQGSVGRRYAAMITHEFWALR